MKKIIIAITLAVSLQMHSQSNDHESGDGNNYCIQSDGNKIFVVYQGIIILSNTVLDNGTIIKTDGTIVTKDGKTTLLRVGQCINRDGTVSASGSPPDNHTCN